ncbi:MAG: hypothetical protein RIC38_03095 [Chromatocurvus sp.]
MGEKRKIICLTTIMRQQENTSQPTFYIVKPHTPRRLRQSHKDDIQVTLQNTTQGRILIQGTLNTGTLHSQRQTRCLYSAALVRAIYIQNHGRSKHAFASDILCFKGCVAINGSAQGNTAAHWKVDELEGFPCLTKDGAGNQFNGFALEDDTVALPFWQPVYQAITAFCYR